MSQPNAHMNKRALLIGSPGSRHNGLRGTTNDVNAMDKLLRDCGFGRITKLCNSDATRANIKKEWNNLIASLGPDDVAVIYYSGHGGIVESHGGTLTTSTGGRQQEMPPRHQYIVPIDMDESDASSSVDFRGILDVEINDFLRRTTDITQNVTIIFDCCHSAHIARESAYVGDATIKSVSPRAHDIAGYIEFLVSGGQLQGDIEVEENPHAVRIYATDIDARAYEQWIQGEDVGLMTYYLVRELQRVQNHPVSWRTIMMRVRELVQHEHKQQRPQSHGPHKRLPFRMDLIPIGPIHFTQEDSRFMLNAGRVAGLKIDDIYTIFPFAGPQVTTNMVLGEARITTVGSFRSEATVEWTDGGNLPREGALAFLSREFYPDRWPLAIPDRPETLVHEVQNSQILRRWENGEPREPLASCALRHDAVLLQTQAGFQIGSSSNLTEDLRSLVRTAEQLARAQHLLTLHCDPPEELLTHGFRATLLTLDADRAEKVVEPDGHIKDGDPLSIRLQNLGRQKIYVSVFSVNVAGNVVLVTGNMHEGREIPTQQVYTINQHPVTRLPYKTLTWPRNVPRTRPVIEHLVFIVTDAPVDLTSLETEAAPRENRNVPRDSGIQTVLYDVIHLSFHLVPTLPSTD